MMARKLLDQAIPIGFGQTRPRCVVHQNPVIETRAPAEDEKRTPDRIAAARASGGRLDRRQLRREPVPVVEGSGEVVLKLLPEHKTVYYELAVE